MILSLSWLISCYIRIEAYVAVSLLYRSCAAVIQIPMCFGLMLYKTEEMRSSDTDMHVPYEIVP